MTPNWKPECKPTYHRDGSVSYWDVVAQQWARRPAHQIPEAVQASHDDAFRRRVANMAVQYHRDCASHADPVAGVEDIDGALGVYGQDAESGNAYQFVYRSGGAGFAELWINSDHQTRYVCRVVPTPVRMIDHVCAAILARQEAS